MIEIDHVALGVTNLYEGYMRFRRETGLEVIEGGFFPSMGLANKLVPTGNGTFIEIESVIDYRAAQNDEIGRWYYDAIKDGDKWTGLCLRVGDLTELEEVAARLERTGNPFGRDVNGTIPITSDTGYFMADGEMHPPQPKTPDAKVWIEGMPLYFLMDMSDHVGDTPMPHATPTHGFSWLEVGGSVENFQDFLGIHPDELSIRCNGKDKLGVYAVAVATDGDDIVIRHDWE